MAFLGLFSKRDKRKAQDAANDTASAASDLDPSEPDYVLPSTKGASLYSVPAASSSKLRLGFKSKKPPQAARTDTNLLSPPSAFQSFRSESENDLSPPPPRSAVFAGYGDPTGAHSTRSLPSKPTAHSRSASKEHGDHGNGVPLPPPQKNSKSGGLFSWAHRERKKSKAPPPPTPFIAGPRPDVSLDSESFNLRSFRHVRPESPNELQPSMMPPVRPRPRENSFASDTSQRISVAAFREAQARRSAANSPTPSSVTMLSPGSTTGLRPPSTFAARKSRSISGDSDTDDSDEGDSSAQEATLKPRRNRSTKSRNVPPLVVPGKKAVSELGHRATPTTAPMPPHMVHSASANPAVSQVGSSKDSAYARPRASASTSALQPNAAARRASVILAQQQQTKQPPQQQQRAQPQRQGKPAAVPAKPASKTSRPASSSSSSSSSSSDDSDSDDAPLAQLVGPKRPGSAASSAPSSTSRSRLPPKPLIDIAGMAPPTFPPVFAEIDRPPVPAKDSPQQSPIVPSPRVSISSPGHASKPSINDRLARLTKGAQSPVENTDKHGHRTRATPTRSQTQPVESMSLPPRPSDEPFISSTPPLRLVNGRSMSSPNATMEDAKDPEESSPIVPIPIRTRTPPPTFAVTSRPVSQASQQSGPDPRVSEETVRMRQRASTLLSDGDFASNKGFTGGGLLAGGSPASQGTPTPASRGRQRSSTLIATPSTSTASFPSTSPGDTPPTRANVRVSLDMSSRVNARTPQDPSPRQNVRISQDPPTRLVARSASPDSSRSTGTSDTPSSKGLRSTFKPKSALKNSSQSSPVAPPASRQATFGSLATPPPKPFAGATYTVALRGNSPASSTGDSSSGRTPITPVDGADLRAASAARKRGHRKSSSAAFDEPSRGRFGLREQEKAEASDPEESRRRERRRSEAKAAIELGKIVNGRGPIATDDDDEGTPMNMGPRMSMFNPMMTGAGAGVGVGMSPMANNPMAWSQPGSPGGMMNPMFPMMTPGADPMLLAAHQQAMMVAKQAFQMAYAQQALAAANEEWERGSTAASVYGGGGMGGMGSMGAMSAMGGMGGMGGGLMPGMMPWGMQMFPSSQSMYAGSVIGGSEIGGPSMAAGRGAGWGSRTTYGAQGGYSGTAAERASAVYRNSQIFTNGMGVGAARSEVGGPSAAGGRGQPRQRTKTGPESPPQASPGTPGKRGGPPPSSWNTRSKPL